TSGARERYLHLSSVRAVAIRDQMCCQFNWLRGRRDVKNSDRGFLEARHLHGCTGASHEFELTSVRGEVMRISNRDVIHQADVSIAVLSRKRHGVRVLQ